VLWGECIAGALYLPDFRRMAAKAGFVDARVLQVTRACMVTVARVRHTLNSAMPHIKLDR